MSEVSTHLVHAPTVVPNRILNALLTIASRDVRRFLRDRERLISSLIFPLVFVGVLGGTSQDSLGSALGFNVLHYIFIGVYAQTLFQSTATGVISLIEDRENDFSQEMFIAPISRYAIISGKILGESLVALIQGVAVLLFGIILFGVRMSPIQLLVLIPVSLLVCLLGGAFGILILSLVSSQRAANQIFPFILLPQFFLGGVLTPITNLKSPILVVLSHIAPLRYAVDLTRAVFYTGTPEASKTILDNPVFNLIVIAGLFAIFLMVGTFLFVRNERNR